MWPPAPRCRFAMPRALLAKARRYLYYRGNKKSGQYPTNIGYINIAPGLLPEELFDAQVQLVDVALQLLHLLLRNHCALESRHATPLHNTEPRIYASRSRSR
eukprot:481333-Pleurochrysis_carterae.AAC.1